MRMKNLFLIIGLIVLIFCSSPSEAQNLSAAKNQITTDAVCPPFFLKDEAGNIIDPVNNINADKPYSPKETCGAAGCHDYNKITKGYHFTQGAGEQPTPEQSERIQWASTPGNYGGNWCSPAPLYRYLSPKENDDPKTMDMTSFSFITAGCGNCHPGGGSAEYDRNGNRYDKFMVEKGYTAGGDNGFDGDYYQARWSETGVLETDCMICHQPDYNYSERKKQLANLNFKWAPTAAAGWATVTGAIQKNESVKVAHNTALFDADGRISPHIVREPRNNACLECHAQPGWKKRGANFSARTDVHLRAGLKCVDCHPAGSKALDKRINEREMHQIAKGDDPGGVVRNDLDNTMLDCDYCHSNGHLGAPISKHTWLPPMHLDNIACQTCHIPQRTVKPAQFQAGDVFNPGTKIPSKGKHLWTFYGPDMQYYNHYGNMGMMGFDDKPTDPFAPVLARYKGKIYPINRIHSAWPAIEIQGKPGLMQPKMGDIYKMWTTHFSDSNKYPELSKITDDNGDGVIEVNRAEEIDALIAGVTNMLTSTGYPMHGKKVVWAMNDRVYRSGTEFHTIPKEEWEASPYANVHTYNHDVYPASTALGANGCTDCHSTDSRFFGSVVQYPFDEQGKPVMMAQYKILGLNGGLLTIGAFRETYFKPALYLLLLLLCCVFIGWAYKKLVENRQEILPSLLTKKWMPLVISITAVIGFFIMLAQSQLRQYGLPTRFWLDSNHFLISALILIGAFIFAVQQNRRTFQWLFTFIVIAIVAGAFMLLKLPSIGFLTRLGYSVFDLAIILILIVIFLLSFRNMYRGKFNLTES